MNGTNIRPNGLVASILNIKLRLQLRSRHAKELENTVCITPLLCCSFPCIASIQSRTAQGISAIRNSKNFMLWALPFDTYVRISSCRGDIKHLPGILVTVVQLRIVLLHADTGTQRPQTTTILFQSI